MLPSGFSKANAGRLTPASILAPTINRSSYPKSMHKFAQLPAFRNKGIKQVKKAIRFSLAGIAIENRMTPQ